VIGNRLAHDYFENDIGINKLLTIEGSAFRVIGIFEDGGSSIYMPLQSAYQVLEDSVKDEYDSIVLIPKDGTDIDELETEITKKLMMSRHVTEKDQDFTIQSSAAFTEMRSDMLGTITGFLTAIAAISLLVGAVGIANTMFTSVLERTKQIGIMKAIGAQNKDVLLMFVLNAGIIGLIGGVIGVLIGWLLSLGMGLAMGMQTIVGVDIIAIALGVSVIVGMIAGIVPAYQGSQLNPVDALRYE
jgi:putative ABC transport system permease protein